MITGISLSFYIKSIGIIAPGFDNWSEAEQVLLNPKIYTPQPVAKKLTSLLSGNERRRATRVTQLALAAAQQIGAAEQLRHCLQIFTSSHGDLSTFNHIGLSLNMSGRPVSPTRFHNSVHNAPAGYWSIASNSQTASSSICAYNDSFAAGLLEAAVQLNASDNPIRNDCLLVCYDEIPPDAFLPQFNISEEFACALLLSQSAQNALAKIEITLNNGTQAITALADSHLEKLRLANPQALVLPLLNAIAQLSQNPEQFGETICIPYLEQGMNIVITAAA